MADAAPAAPHLVLDNTFGALLIGVFIAAALWGVTCSQTFIYFTHYPRDKWSLKLLVFAVWLFDTTHQALICHVAYAYLVSNFANINILGSMVNTLVIEVYFNGLTALLVQSFFARRLYILSNKNIWITAVVVSFVAAEFVMVMIYATRGVSFTLLGQLGNLKSISLAVNALAAAGDVLIAISLCWILQTSRTGFKKSDTIITKLIAFSINTGLVTSICALASLITITALPSAFVYITFYFTLGRLYSNSLLATLNARQSLRDASNKDDITMSTREQIQHVAGMANTFGTQVRPESLAVRMPDPVYAFSSNPHQRIPPTMSIKVDTTQRVDYDHSDVHTYRGYKGDSQDEDFTPSDSASAV